MSLFDFISVKLTLALVAGILLGFYFDFGLLFPIIIIMACLIVMGWFLQYQNRKDFLYFEIFVAVGTLFLGTLITERSKGYPLQQHYSHFLITDTIQAHLKIREVLKSTSYNYRYQAQVLRLNEHSVSGKIMLSVPKDSLVNPLQVDDEFVTYTNFNSIKKPLNPHQFNYHEYLKKQGIYHQLFIPEENTIKITNPSKTIFGRASRFRDGLIQSLKKHDFEGEELAIIQALILGQRNDISTSTFENYKNAGAMHILAVSGLHFGILLLLLQFLLRPVERLKHGKTVKGILVILLLWVFAFVAGLSSSILRAVTMFSFVAYSMFLNRPSNQFNILALSMFFLLLINPLLLFHVGFQLSYTAVFAIVWIYPKLESIWAPKLKIARYFWQLFSVSIAAQLGVLPISLYYFHQFPSLFFISNLIIIPVLGGLLGIGILVILLSYINLLPAFLVAIYGFIIRTMNGIIAWIAQQESFVFHTIPFDLFQVLVTYGIIISTVIAFTKPSFKKILIPFIGIVCFQLWGVFQQFQASQKHQLLIPHQYKNTCIWYRKSNSLTEFALKDQFSSRYLESYRTHERIYNMRYQPLQQVYQLNKQQFIVVDSSKQYPQTGKGAIVLLTQSTRANLERLIDVTQPQQIIADGSNYPSFVKRWQLTCAKKKIPFHYTGEKGAYIFSLTKR